MRGRPEKVEGKCCAELHIADDYGDNYATIMCQLDPGHEGPHSEKFHREGTPVVITWWYDETKEEDPENDDDNTLK
jgi:hypothetical protein